MLERKPRSSQAVWAPLRGTMPQSQMKGPTDTRWSTCKGTAVPRHPQESGQVRPVSPRLAARRGHAPVQYLKATRDRPKPHGLISSATGTAAHGSGPPTPPNSRHSSRRPARTQPNGPGTRLATALSPSCARQARTPRPSKR